jgi:hypothetical protein
MILRFSCRQPFLMIIAQEFIEEINGLIRDVSLIFRGDKSSPWFPWVTLERKLILSSKWENKVAPLDEPAKNVIILSVKFDVVLFQVCVKFIRA